YRIWGKTRCPWVHHALARHISDIRGVGKNARRTVIRRPCMNHLTQSSTRSAPPPRLAMLSPQPDRPELCRRSRKALLAAPRVDAIGARPCSATPICKADFTAVRYTFSAALCYRRPITGQYFAHVEVVWAGCSPLQDPNYPVCKAEPFGHHRN